MWCGENIKFKANLKGKFLNGEIQFQLRQMNTVSVLLGVAPPVSVTPRIITFLAGDSYEPSFTTVYGRGKSVSKKESKKTTTAKTTKVRIFNQKKSRKKYDHVKWVQKVKKWYPWMLSTASGSIPSTFRFAIPQPKMQESWRVGIGSRASAIGGSQIPWSGGKIKEKYGV